MFKTIITTGKTIGTLSAKAGKATGHGIVEASKATGSGTKKATFATGRGFARFGHFVASEYRTNKYGPVVETTKTNGNAVIFFMLSMGTGVKAKRTTRRTATA